MPVPIERFGTGAARALAQAADLDGDEVVSESERDAAKSAMDRNDSGWETHRPAWDAFSAQFGAAANPVTVAAAPDSAQPHLTEAQAEALKRVRVLAEQKSAEARPGLLQKFQSTMVGLGEPELDQVLAFIRERARITVNFNPDKSVVPNSYLQSKLGLAAPADPSRVLIDEFIEDGEYLDQFITGISGGSPSAYAGGSRDTWERTIFQGAYHDKPMVPGERPQYGALNATGSAAGAATTYGNSYLVLKPGVGQRATFTPGDSSGARAEDVGTLEHFQHVLWKTNVNLQDITAEALGRPELRAPSMSGWGYLEAQIHGTLEFARDVEAVVGNALYKGGPYEEKLRTFAEKYGLELRWHDGHTVTPG